MFMVKITKYSDAIATASTPNKRICVANIHKDISFASNHNRIIDNIPTYNSLEFDRITYKNETGLVFTSYSNNEYGGASCCIYLKLSNKIYVEKIESGCTFNDDSIDWRSAPYQINSRLFDEYAKTNYL